MTAAYSLSNVLTKIVRHEKRIYGPGHAVLAVDTSEAYNEKTAVHITASLAGGLTIFMNNDEHGRGLALEIDHQTRVCLEKTPTGLRVSLFDRRGVQVRKDYFNLITMSYNCISLFKRK